MNSIVHFEIPADDPKRASKFYSDVFGWQIQPIDGMPYWMLITTELDANRMPKSPGAINGGMGKREGPLKSIVVTVNVDDIDQSLEMVEANGGKTVQKKQAVGDMGFTGYFKDSEGNIVGLWQSAGGM
jgi:predicted enzyme related to lactoylglutathione lyase